MPIRIDQKSHRSFTGIIDSDREESGVVLLSFFFPVKTDGQPSEITYSDSKIRRRS